MKFLSESRSLERLAAIKNRLRDAVSDYEQNAKSCLACETPGACCLDAHFVNVRISRLEAVAIRRSVERQGRFDEIERRTDNAIEEYRLNTAENNDQKFACPLFEPGIGCLVHRDAKPSACIVHACYQDRSDLPPDELLQDADSSVDSLNTRTYGRSHQWLPIPLALRTWR